MAIGMAPAVIDRLLACLHDAPFRWPSAFL